MPMTSRGFAVPKFSFCHHVLVYDARFADRFVAETYEHDPVVSVFESDASERDALWLPERLFERLVGVARAYELHTLPLLGGSERMRLGRAQCESLLDELAFVAERLNDPLAVDVAQALAHYVSRRTSRQHEEVWVTIEGE